LLFRDDRKRTGKILSRHGFRKAAFTLAANLTTSLNDLGSPQEMTYRAFVNSDRRRFVADKRVNSLSQGRDHAHRTPGIGDRDDSVRGAKVDRLSAAGVPGRDGHEV